MISEGECARRDHEFAERGNIASQLGVAVPDHAAIAFDCINEGCVNCLTSN
jgi:hypothetical protein